MLYFDKVSGRSDGILVILPTLTSTPPTFICKEKINKKEELLWTLCKHIRTKWHNFKFSFNLQLNQHKKRVEKLKELSIYAFSMLEEVI